MSDSKKGIIYVMTTVVPGLIKIGKTGTKNFDSRMYHLEHNGYCNVTGLKRAFAIEVEGYSEKEALLHTIFEKSNVANTELFALDIDVVKQLLSSFEGRMVYPVNETKKDVFNESAENTISKVIPDGLYNFRRVKKSENKTVTATVRIKDDNWTLLKGSCVALTDNDTIPSTAKSIRAVLPIDESGRLMSDFDIGKCSPSFAGSVVLGTSNNGWKEWKNSNGVAVDIYRNQTITSDDEDT